MCAVCVLRSLGDAEKGLPGRPDSDATAGNADGSSSELDWCGVVVVDVLPAHRQIVHGRQVLPR